MKKHYPELDTVSQVLEVIPHRQCQSVANAIRVCNDQNTPLTIKLNAIALIFL
ncbi:hypothetical protein [Acinetobacter rudis]|uniref:Uncharacterized protein n=1 Tax=Acinetobacter rudis TaxID=632955 RepID=A0AAW8JBB2_9GAMM|nr:hypothetical protein [Acinetobacter rudis]MDQ8937129.1 hypothetical protein [Acinetobacter rudis]MDQ9019328.1 hypothetical protein [Acinetobacter rudis]